MRHRHGTRPPSYAPCPTIRFLSGKDLVTDHMTVKYLPSPIKSLNIV